MTMKRFRSAAGAAAVVALAGLLGLATVPGAPAQDVLKLTSYVPVGSGTWNLYQKPFIDHVHDLTDGQVKIKGFSVGVLASPFDAWKKVQQGVADICYCFPAFAANTDPANAILTVPNSTPSSGFGSTYANASYRSALPDSRAA